MAATWKLKFKGFDFSCRHDCSGKVFVKLVGPSPRDVVGGRVSRTEFDVAKEQMFAHWKTVWQGGAILRDGAGAGRMKFTGKAASIEYKGFTFTGRYGCKGVLYIWPDDVPGLTMGEREGRKRAGMEVAAKWRKRGQLAYFRPFPPVEGKGSTGD